MKKYFLLLAFPILFSCGGDENKSNPVEDSLNAVNSSLNTKITEKEAVINDFLKSFNEIQENLNEIKAKEKIISTSTQSAELQKTKKDEIVEDIQMIYELMSKNKQKISSLNNKLKKSNLKIDELEKLINNLNTQLADKEIEITELKSQLERLNIELADLKMTFEEEKYESALKTEKINTAYYAFGTSKELIKKGVITKEGGFIGIGKSKKLTQDFNKEYFTKIDVTQTKEIALSCKQAKLLTSHPSNSYKFEGTKEKTEKLVILNTEEFWSVSKYLVVQVEL